MQWFGHPRTWIQFFNFAKNRQDIVNDIIEDVKKDGEIIKEKMRNNKKDKFKDIYIPKKQTFWQFTILYDHGVKSIISTTIPDSDKFKGQDAFDDILEWFQCSNNPSFKHIINGGLTILIRSKIVEMQLLKIEKEK